MTEIHKIINLNPKENKTKIIPFTKESLIYRLEYLFMIKTANRIFNYLELEESERSELMNKLIENFHSKIYSKKNYIKMTQLNNLKKSIIES